MNRPNEPWKVESARPEATRAIRRRVLRPGQTDHELIVDYEEHPDARWFVVELERRVVGCAAALPDPRPSGAADGIRIRAMATDSSFRSRGIGTALLVACVVHAASREAGEVWCTARIETARFYLSKGFEPIGEPFDLDGLGPHVVLTAVPGVVLDQLG